MTTDQKTTVVNWLINIAGATPTLNTSYWGYRFNATFNGLYAGLAFYGDGINNNQAQTYVNFIPTWLLETRAISHAGASPSGLAYGWYGFSGTYSGQQLAQDFWLLTTATTNIGTAETFNTYPYMKNAPYWYLYGFIYGWIHPNVSLRTDGFAVTPTDDTASNLWNWYFDDIPFIQMVRIMTQVAILNNDTTTAQLFTWFTNTRLGIPKSNTTWDIIFNDRTTTATDPATLGISGSKAFGWNTTNGTIDSYLTNPRAGRGDVFMKSSWANDVNTTQAYFRAFPYHYYGHMHEDSLTFSIYKGEPLILSPAGRYYYYYEGGAIDTVGAGFPHHHAYYKRGLSSNTILIMDPNEVIQDITYTNSFKDGSQRTSTDALIGWGTASIPGGTDDWGGLIAYEDTADYTFSSGDATKGYNSTVGGVNYLSPGASPKTTLVQRDFVYLKSSGGIDDYFVVFDRVNSINPAHKKVFLLHTVGEPILNGSQSTIYGNSSNGLFRSTNSNSFHVYQTKAKLFGKTLLPTSTTLYKMGGNITTTTTASINATMERL